MEVDAACLPQAGMLDAGCVGVRIGKQKFFDFINFMNFPNFMNYFSQRTTKSLESPDNGFSW